MRECSIMVEKKDEYIIKEIANNRLYTYGDYLNWNDDEKRYELIDGRVYMMTAALYRIHQKVLTELFRQIANYLVDKECEVYLAPFDVRLPDKKSSSLPGRFYRNLVLTWSSFTHYS